MASRSRSRSPLRQDNESLPASGRASPAQSNTSITTPTSNITDKNKGTFTRFPQAKDSQFKLKLCNIPLSWVWKRVLGYIKKNTMRVNKAIHEDIMYISLNPSPAMPNVQESYVSFKTENHFNEAFLALKQTFEKVEGKKLFVQKVVPGSKSARANERDTFRLQQGQTKVRAFSRNGASGDDNETYGLSAKYLHDLGITVKPLTRKVYVRNLPEQYNDEAKVRSVFSLAGTLVLVQLLPKKNNSCNARLEYDHPVEAVQAVSMFNKRELYGTIIKCEMDTLTNKVWIDGMPMRGPGLGPDGLPMRGVRVAVEIKKAKAEIMSKVQMLNDTIDELKGQMTNLIMQVESYKGQQNSAPPVQNVPNPVQNVPNPLQTVANPLAALGSLLTNQLQPIQLLQGLLQQNTGNDMGVLGNVLNNLTGSNMDLSSLIQGLSNNQSGTVQGGPSMQGTSNMQINPNMQGGPNMQSGPNVQGGPDNMQRRPSNNIHHGSFNMQSDPASNMQRGPNNIQPGPSNMQNGPNNMQSRPNNMPSGPNNMPSGPNNMRSGSYGPTNVQSGPHMQADRQNMQHGNPRPFIQGQNNNAGYSGQVSQLSGFANMQSGYSNMQPQSGPGQNQQMNAGFGEPSYNNNMHRQEPAGTGSNMLLFRNLPTTVTMPALQGKMREVGEVKLVEMTGPGRALVGFYNDRDADKCMQLFNHSNVDGQTIDVRKV